MNALDQWISQLDSGPWTILIVATLLGLRHATDPDHIAAVSTLVLGRRGPDSPRAHLLGAAWGLGHGTTLFLFGLPIVLFRKFLPDAVHQVAEIAIGAIIVLLAARLLLRWRRGYFHVHPHAHDEVVHAHPHLHEHSSRQDHPQVHQHRHAEAIGRTPVTSFGIGLIHGVGGSAGAGILLVSAAETTTAGVVALLLFALGTAVSMTVITYLMGALLGRSPARRPLGWMIPALGVASLCFGLWYGWEGVNSLSR
jgi:ABC-type nickel/cobalt efflux system permease component RcnA